MAYALVWSACVNCKRIFGYNPHHVPSIVVKGVREPVCEPCFDANNARRIAEGLEPFKRHPDAYEPIHESEL